jgi:hypothetical protein
LGRCEAVGGLWRNNTGALTDAHGRLVRYGLAVGSADLVGIVTVPVAALVAAGVESVGVFLAIEVKRPDEKPRPEQAQWLEVVRKAKGCAGVATSETEAAEIVERAARGLL